MSPYKLHVSIERKCYAEGDRWSGYPQLSKINGMMKKVISETEVEVTKWIDPAWMNYDAERGTASALHYKVGDQVCVYLPYGITAAKTAEVVCLLQNFCDSEGLPEGNTGATCVPLSKHVSLRQEYFMEDYDALNSKEPGNQWRRFKRINGHTDDKKVQAAILTEIRESPFFRKLRDAL